MFVYTMSSASSASLLLVLSHLYKDYVYVPIFFLLLDVFGHWVHMYATLLSGGKLSHHCHTVDYACVRIMLHGFYPISHTPCTRDTRARYHISIVR